MVYHRFQEELSSLEMNPLVGKYHLLVIGTFNAEDDDDKKNDSLWFYGRPENEFWCLFPRMMGMPTLHQADADLSPQDLKIEWKRFCQEQRIVIVDIFKSVHAHLPNHSDKHLKNLKKNNYTLFDFEKAFQNCYFDGVLFTWAENENKKNLLSSSKKSIIDFLNFRSKYFMHMVSPSMAYPKPRYFKLLKWREEYNKLKQRMYS